MNKRKLVRNVSLVALSAVMMCGTAAVFAGCGGGGGAYNLTVNIFCNDTDAATNRKICNDWAAEYTQKLQADGVIGEDQEITVTFRYNNNTDRYFDALMRNYSSGKAADIVYLSPKYVKSWVQLGRVMDISGYIDPEDEDTISRLNGIWNGSLGLYGYAGQKGNLADGYMMGDALTYKTTADDVDEPGFYTEGGVKAGLYGLPKDYSNFVTGFNGKFFTEDLKKAMTTQTATTQRNVKGARGFTADLTFTGEGETDTITYEVDGTYTNPYTKQTMTATLGEPAPIINIGVPTRYKPYNFYRFANFTSALEGNDPIALSVSLWSEDVTGDGEGDGYVVTIPGFPGETFEIEDAKIDNFTADPNAIYDTSIGHITYTYQEFGALTWAICYYYNTFNWNCKDADNDAQEFDINKTTSGTAGIKMGSGVLTNVYGNDQYEGAPNPTLYLLPWLYGNDADFIDQNSTRAIAGTSGNAADYSTLNTIAKMREEYEKNAATDKGETRVRLKLDGTPENRQISYGANTQAFIDTYGAFLEYGSTWNGNCGNCGDEPSTKSDNGWSFFRSGAEVFYGAGTWDSATRNESDLRSGPEGYCDYQLLPQCVGEKYALFSTVKDGFYDYQTYVASDPSEEATKYSKLEDAADVPTEPYDMEDIYKNQVLRQNKWGARMDSVGFAANASLLNKKDKEAWKAAGAVDLIMALSIGEANQVTLTYSGAQIPNFQEQCVDFLNYSNKKYVGGELIDNDKYVADGAFSKMITPEGSATVTGEQGKALWDAYYQVAYDMDQAARGLGRFRGQSGKTVAEFLSLYTLDENGVGKLLQAGAANAGKIYVNGAYQNIEHDPQYDSVKLSEFTGEISKRAFAMKILYMTTFTYADRDLNLRMQYGLNSARDSAMYTYNVEWINLITMRNNGMALAYNLCQPLTQAQIKSYGNAAGGANAKLVFNYMVKKLASEDLPGGMYQTAAAFLLRTAQQVQDKLDQAIAAEKAEIEKVQGN